MSIIYEMALARDERKKISKKCINAIERVHKRLNLKKTKVGHYEDKDFIKGKKTNQATVCLEPSDQYMLYGNYDVVSAITFLTVELGREYISVHKDIKKLSEYENDIIREINDSISPYTVDSIDFKKISIRINISKG